MASLFHRSDGNSLQCAVIVKAQDGSQKRITRSLHTTDKAKATATGDALQSLATGLSDPQRRQQRHLLAFIGAIFDAAGVVCPLDKPETGAVRFSEFSSKWLERKGRTSKPATIAAAKGTIDMFLSTFDDPTLSAITGQMIQDHYDAQIKAGLAMSTTNNRLAILSSIFRHAVAMGTIQINPAASVQAGKATGVVPRESLSDEDFDKLMRFFMESTEVDACSWQTAALLGKYCGLRLQDAVNLPRKAVSVVEEHTILTFRAMKTGRIETVPVLYPPLCVRLKDTVGDFCCPGIHGKPGPWLSRKFSDLLIAAGIESPVIKTGSGRSHRQHSFHSLRHSHRSWLAKLGIPSHLSMLLMGHRSASTHEGYNHASAVDLAKNLAPFLKP